MSTYIEYYVDCPDPGLTPPTQTECFSSKSVSWSSPGLQSEFFYVEDINQNILGFTFSGITNNGSSVSVDVVYKRNGVTITAETFNLGVIVSNNTEYHYLDFGSTTITSGLIFLKFNISGGSSGSLNVFLNCSVSVGSRKFCWQLTNIAPRNLCTKCDNQITLYFPKPFTSLSPVPNNNLFYYGDYYIDPKLTTLATPGYYTPVGAPNPKVIYAITGGTPTIAHMCDPTLLGCNSSLTQNHKVSTDYTNNNPYIPGVEDITLSGLKYSIKNYFIDFNSINPGYFTLTISNTQTYQKEVLFTVSDANAPAGEVGLISYTEDPLANTEFFRVLAPQTIFSVPINSSKTIRFSINGQPSRQIKLLRVRVAVSLPKKFKNSAAADVTTTVSASCLSTTYSASTGIHAYSAYDSYNTPKCYTTLYSLISPGQWTTNSRVYHDPYFVNPALPYFYSYNTQVFKVGQPFKREFGIKLSYELKTSLIRQVAKWLKLSKKNPVSVTEKTEGPKDWQTATQVPSCIEPTMNDIGLIKFIYTGSLLPIPSSYQYLVGKSTVSKIAANDSVFGLYDWNNKTYSPITGLIHALEKVVAGYVKASTDISLRRIQLSSWAPYAIGGLGALASAIAISPSFFGLSLATATMTKVNVAILNTVQLMCINPASVTSAGVVSSTGIGVIIVIIALIILLLFWPVKKRISQDNCLMFDKVYTNNEYLELTDTIYTLSGLTNPGISGYYTDGGYFYTTTSGTINSKEVSYTNMDGARKYSIRPDVPNFITNIQSFYLLPYVSGRPVNWTTPQFRNQAISTSIFPTTLIGALNTPSQITYSIPEGFFDADSQEEADNLATVYLSGLTAQTAGIYISADPLPTAKSINTIFTHEIKIENQPSIWPICFNDNDNSNLQIGKTLYYDSNGLYTVLDGYYSLSGINNNFRTFYKTSAGTIIEYYSMSASSSPTVTASTGGILSVVTTGQTFSSSWYFFGPSLQDVMYDDSNDIHGFTDTWNTSSFYSSEFVSRGMISTPASKSSFYIYDDNVGSYSFGNAPEGWYNEIPGSFNEDPFLIQSADTIYLDSIQYCSEDDQNGIYVTCVDESGNTSPSYYGVTGELYVYTSSGLTAYEFEIQNEEYRVLVPLGTEFIGAVTAATTYITSINPIKEITFTNGTFYSCITPTPTPTPVVGGFEIQLSTPQSTDCVACRLTSYSQTRYVAQLDYNPTVGDIVYQNSNLSTVFDGNNQWFKTSWGSPTQYSIQIDDNGQVTSLTNCSTCPTQTPSPTETPTPTPTPASPSSTPTPTVTETPTLTPSETSTIIYNYEYGVTRCSNGTTTTVISATQVSRFSIYKSAPDGSQSECYTINTNASLTTDPPNITFYSQVIDCTDGDCIQ